MKDTDTLQEVGNVKDGKQYRVTADMLREWLIKYKRPYSWLAKEIGVSESSVKQWLSPNTTNGIPKKHRGKIAETMFRYASIEQLYNQRKNDKPTEDHCANSTNASQNATINYTINEELARLLENLAASERIPVQHLLDDHLHSWALQMLRTIAGTNDYGTAQQKWHRELADLRNRIKNDERELRTQKKVLDELRADLQKRRNQVENAPDVWAYRSYVDFLESLIKSEGHREQLMEKTLHDNQQKYDHLYSSHANPRKEKHKTSEAGNSENS